MDQNGEQDLGAVTQQDREGGAQGFLARLFDALERDLREAAKDVQLTLEDSLSHPVVRNFDGSVRERSPVGGYPWKDEGQLVGNVESAVVRAENGDIIMAVGVSRPDTPDAPAALEYGWGNMKGERPFMRMSMTQVAAPKIEGVLRTAAEKQT